MVITKCTYILVINSSSLYCHILRIMQFQYKKNFQKVFRRIIKSISNWYLPIKSILKFLLVFEMVCNTICYCLKTKKWSFIVCKWWPHLKTKFILTVILSRIELFAYDNREILYFTYWAQEIKNIKCNLVITVFDSHINRISSIANITSASEESKWMNKKITITLIILIYDRVINRLMLNYDKVLQHY